MQSERKRKLTSRQAAKAQSQSFNLERQWKPRKG
jgi:hypothetical protein